MPLNIIKDAMIMRVHKWGLSQINVNCSIICASRPGDELVSGRYMNSEIEDSKI